jgi:hypothetical protein
MPNEYKLYYQWDVEVDSQLTPLAVRNSDTATTLLAWSGWCTGHSAKSARTKDEGGRMSEA